MRKVAFLLAALAVGALMSESASAGGRVVVGFGFGFPLWYPAPWHYAPAPYYYPPPVVISRAPITYIERREVTPASTDWWYYCQQSNSYYPYVKTCPGGWQKVSPTPSE
jgi:hypothetical protein